MKPKIVLAMVLLPTLQLVQAQQQETPAVRAEQYYQSGLAAVKRGDAVNARRSFEAALRLNPGHANARYHLLQLRGAEGQLGGRARELRLGQVRLPVVQFDDASLQEVIDGLDLLVRKQTNDEFTPNFVIQDSTGALAKTEVNIQLRNVPAKTVLDYAIDQAGATVRYDEHAILIRPLRKPAPAAPAAE